MTKRLSFDDVLAILMTTFKQLADGRTGKNIHYPLCDAALAAFGVFFTQSPSFLAYQRDMQRRKGQSNARSLFGVEEIPSDQQIRNLLDPIAPEQVGAPFWSVLERLKGAKVVDEAFQFEGGWLCSLDGTQYFSSSTIHCPNCTVTVHNETPHYSHTVLIPALVMPDKSEVLVLEPEFIVPQDGAVKQDCERNAAKRWVKRNAGHFAGQRVTLLADDLHCNQPFCELLSDHHLDFVMTCKPDSHEALYTELALLEKLGAVTQFTDRLWTGRGHERWTYRFVNHVPMRAGAKALYVNWCQLTIVNEASGLVLYRNAFATNHEISEHTVRVLIRAGRTRWKIENENNNVLKNQGYHLEHNYGHGHQHLSTMMVTLALLAFLCHTVLQLCDANYQRLRAELGARRTFFDDIRTLTRYFFFPSWTQLLSFMLIQLELDTG
jgi:hypothetical protein